MLLTPFLWIHFPVWRELKLMTIKANCSFFKDSLNTLSRLKGIETLCQRPLRYWIDSSEYTFPFEGNWNLCLSYLLKSFRLRLWIHFPVWRELKQIKVTGFLQFYGNPLNTLSRLKGIETKRKINTSENLLPRLWIHFPVWRELKPFKDHFKDHCLGQNSEYTFPFEGNWNSCLNWMIKTKTMRKLWIHFPVWRELKFFLFAHASVGPTLNTLSRLKGIETFT